VTEVFVYTGHVLKRQGYCALFTSHSVQIPRAMSCSYPGDSQISFKKNLQALKRFPFLLPGKRRKILELLKIDPTRAIPNVGNGNEICDRFRISLTP